jgi:TolB-like protein
VAPSSRSSLVSRAADSKCQSREAKVRKAQIANELSVDAIVEGSVLREGNRVRVTDPNYFD